MGKYYFGVEGIQAVAKGKVFNRYFLRLEQLITCAIITDLCILVFKFAQ